MRPVPLRLRVTLDSFDGLRHRQLRSLADELVDIVDIDLVDLVDVDLVGRVGRVGLGVQLRRAVAVFG
ncbi:hypothetical protein SAMN02745121_00294 [Nannocystis exedens]|uniref:Uncharacterized protein n=1 Tax=Nannocystis exedens TaxID=54 RepID=A0A1I1SV78_9BACT|nr:hypothetical protein NAEX_08866 [Nannocystis exedens]SFD50286.1 hypothetical protein SAMN02745121_00294 [Nannocystis exedens]